MATASVGMKVVDSKPQIQFYKSGDSTNAMVKMVNETNEFKMQKYTGSSLEDVMRINEDGVITFPKNVQFLGSQTVINTDTLTFQDQQIDLGLSNTTFIDSTSSRISKATDPGTTIFTLSDSSQVANGDELAIAKTDTSASPGYNISTGAINAPTFTLDTFYLSGSVLSIQANYAPSSPNLFSDLGLYRRSASNPDPATDEGKIFNVTSLVAGSVNITFHSSTIAKLAVNRLIVLSAGTSSTTTGLIGKVGRITAINAGSNEVTILYDSFVTNTGGLDASGSAHTIFTYTQVSGLNFTNSSFTAGGYLYTFRLADTNAQVPFSRGDYVMMQNLVDTSSNKLLHGAAMYVNAVNNSTAPYTLQLKSPENLTIANISNTDNVILSKLSAVGENSGVRLLGQYSGSLVTGGINYDSSRHLALENTAGKIKIGCNNVAESVDIATAGARQVNIGSASAGAIAAQSSAGVTLTAAAASSFSTSSGALTLSGVGGVNVNASGADISIGSESGNANKVLLGSGGRTVEIGASSSTTNVKGNLIVDGSVTSGSLNIASTGTSTYDSTGSTTFSVTANAATAKSLSLSATNSGAGAANINIDAKSSLNIGATTASAVDFNATTFDLDASDALTIDSATSIAIGTAVDKPVTLNSTTFDVNSSGNITIDSSSSLAIGATSASAVDFNATTFDLDASGALTIDSATSIAIGAASAKPVTMNASTFTFTSDDTTSIGLAANGSSTKTFTISADNASTGSANLALTAKGSLNLDGTGAVNIGATNASAVDFNATTFDLDASGALTIDSATSIAIGTTVDRPVTVESSTFGLTASDDTTLSLTANSSTNKTFTLSATNSHVTGTSALALTADGAVSVDGSAGLNIGTTTASAVDFNATTFDLDASGALTIDSATSIAIGTAASKPLTVSSTTLDITANDSTTLALTANSSSNKTLTIAATNSHVTGVANLALSADGALTVNSSSTVDLDATGTLSINSSGGVINIGDDNVNQNINIGTSGSRTITIGGSGATVVMPNVSATSDQRLKENIKPLESSLEKVRQVDGYSYTWIAEPQQGEQIGFIAQELETVFPQLVNNLDNGYKSVNYLGMIAVLVEAIKEQQAQIEELKARLS